MELKIWSPVRLFGATPGAVVGISLTDIEVLFDPGGWRPGYDRRVPPWAELPEDLKSAPGLFSPYGSRQTRGRVWGTLRASRRGREDRAEVQL